MADYTQSATQDLLAHQEITHPGNVVGSDVSCAGWLELEVFAWVANIETTANATGVTIVIQVSGEASGNDWQDLIRWTGSTTAAETEVLTATEPIGEKTIAVASTTNLVVGDIIYIKDDTGVDESEWHEIAAVATNTSISLVDGLAVEKVANDDIYDQAQRFYVGTGSAGTKRISAVVIHQAGTGSDIRVKVTAVGATAVE